jgi:hypothetical protein
LHSSDNSRAALSVAISCVDIARGTLVVCPEADKSEISQGNYFLISLLAAFFLVLTFRMSVRTLIASGQT